MSKKLAIKGHPTRSKEVVELLRMLGGNDSNDFKCSNPNRFYHVLNGHICWGYIGPEEIDEYHIFTLEEFLEKYPFYNGDKVFDIADGDPGIITAMNWDEDVSDMKYHVLFDNGDMGWYTNDTIAFLKKDTDKVVDNFRKKFCEYCGSQRCSGQDDELEYCERFKNLIDNLKKPSVKNHKMGPKSKLPSKYYEDKLEKIKSKREYDELRMPLDDDDKLATEATIMDKKILPPDGYLVGKITRTDNGMLVEYVEKKPVYPKIYEECCKALKISNRAQLSYTNPDVERGNTYLSGEKYLLDAFMKLRICRNAYWKIAGEQMGLGKSWQPSWSDTNEEVYGIQLVTDDTNMIYHESAIFTFPTEEILNEFCENFKDLIEQCKELL